LVLHSFIPEQAPIEISHQITWPAKLNSQTKEETHAESRPSSSKSLQLFNSSGVFGLLSEPRQTRKWSHKPLHTPCVLNAAANCSGGTNNVAGKLFHHAIGDVKTPQNVFHTALEQVRKNLASWPGFDANLNSSIPKVLVFTICSRASGYVDASDDIYSLCDVQLQGMQIWGRRQSVAFRQVRDVGILDQSRAPHWQKVAYIHAFLSEGWDVVFFLDADSMIADPSWNLRSYVDRLLPLGSSKMFLATDDTLDWHSTGEIICRKHSLTLQWLEDWYHISENFFGSLLPMASLRPKRSGLNTDPLDAYQRYITSEERHLVERRCSAFKQFHEQGCLNQFYSASPVYLKHLVIVDADELRRMTLDNPSSSPIVHICCKPRDEQASDLAQCVRKIRQLGRC